MRCLSRKLHKKWCNYITYQRWSHAFEPFTSNQFHWLCRYITKDFYIILTMFCNNLKSAISSLFCDLFSFNRPSTKYACLFMMYKCPVQHSSGWSVRKEAATTRANVSLRTYLSVQMHIDLLVLCTFSKDGYVYIILLIKQTVEFTHFEVSRGVQKLLWHFA